jgi:pimeloyl-ACP methyl ester carboxylesterase
LIWGKNDTITPPEVAQEFQDKLPQADLFWIDECGHAPMMEHPKEFNKILEKWLDKTFGDAD